ncbi:hypothetical protein RHSIM_Rhsim07G0130400 [Rhododendron simsii]|uniref:FAD-binding domain-containing protein n=1 Tax=Rhododendron simsii TaxID=118357 RepID=A0A834LIF8_RHOSS|nr:hypothetical protein RHSIM_Rhsim07G0130400 [Rhododendron simsii]
MTRNNIVIGRIPMDDDESVYRASFSCLVCISSIWTIVLICFGGLLQILIGCQGVNSVIANYVGLNPPRQSSITNVRAFTNYLNGHGFGPEFVTIKERNLLLGRIPIDHKLVYILVCSSCTDTLRYALLTYSPIYTEPRGSYSTLHLEKETVTVAGDVMHVMGPFLGQGGSIALEDAVDLARCLARVHRGHDNNRENTGNDSTSIQLAIDEYVRHRRTRLVQVSTKTYTLGSLLETSSVFVKLVCIIVMIVIYRDQLGHTRYDCGHL